MKKLIWLGALWGLAGTLQANPPMGGRSNDFMERQAFAETQRLAGQIDILQENQDALAERLGRLEGGKGELAMLRSEMDALRADIDAVRREMATMRDEIVRDLTKKLTSMMPREAPRTPPAPPPRAYTGPQSEYVVVSGDTLSLIAQAFNTTVSQIREMNNLKNDTLRIGQKLRVPRHK